MRFQLLKKFDIYIIKKFLGTFFYAIGLIISISIIFDISENIDEFIENEALLAKLKRNATEAARSLHWDEEKRNLTQMIDRFV